VEFLYGLISVLTPTIYKESMLIPQGDAIPNYSDELSMELLKKSWKYISVSEEK
jgi:hypothetical protein